jgi:MFS transporter, DHA1 family, solute carrier family 18 (vesicular amine transporter), member 1/2
MPRQPTTPRAALVVAVVALSTDLLVYGIVVPVLPQLAAVTEAGPSAAGLLFACYAAALIAATPVAGWWVNRAGPRGPLLTGLLGLGVTTALFAFGRPLALLLAARLTQGVAAALSWVAGLALVAAVTPFAQRGRNLGLVLSGANIGTLLGPLVGGFLADYFGTAAPFLFAAAIAVSEVILQLLLIRRTPTAIDDTGTIRGVLRVPGAWSATFIALLGAAVLSVLEPILPLQLAATGVSSGLIGVIFAVAILAVAVTTPWAGDLVTKSQPQTPVLAGILLSVATLLVLAHTHTTGVILVAMAALGTGSGLILGSSVAVLSTVGERSTPPTFGTVSALANLAYAVGLLLGPGSSGPLTSATSYTAAITITAGATLIIGVLSAFRLPKVAISGGDYSVSREDGCGRLRQAQSERGPPRCGSRSSAATSHELRGSGRAAESRPGRVSRACLKRATQSTAAELRPF